MIATYTMHFCCWNLQGKQTLILIQKHSLYHIHKDQTKHCQLDVQHLCVQHGKPHLCVQHGKPHLCVQHGLLDGLVQYN